MKNNVSFLLVILPLVFSCQQNKDLERRKAKIVERNTTKAGVERKSRSEKILEQQGVPFISSLPVIEDESIVKLRTVDGVARRAMALCLVAVKGEGLEQSKIIRFMNRYDIEKDLTTKEREFVFNEKPSQQDIVQFTWRYESYWVMLWALGYVDELGRPDHICDVPKAAGIMRDMTATQFIEKSKLRSPNEILDQADLIYRYHWAIVDARINSKEPPANLDPSVIYERHYALNWLIGYMEQEWDDISTDT